MLRFEGIPGYLLGQGGSDASSSPGPESRAVRSIRLLILCGLLLAAAVIVASIAIIIHLRARALAETERELENMSLVLADQADRAFGAIELVQNGVIERMGEFPVASTEEFDKAMSSYGVHNFLRDSINGLPHIETIAIINSGGKMINFSRFWPPPPDIDTSDHDFFKAFTSNPDLTSFLGEPIFNRTTGTWSIYLARKFTGRNGELLGMVLGGMQLQYFDDLFADVALGADGVISLFRSDGMLLARHPAQITPGTPYSNTTLFKGIMSKGGHGVIRFSSHLDGREHIVAAHALARYPAAIGVGKTITAAFADWREQTKLLVTAVVMMLLVLAGIVLGGVRRLKTYEVLAKAQAERVKAETARTTAEAVLREREHADAIVRHQRLQLTTALDNMPQGLVMFDANARVLVCNNRYKAMYALSPELGNPGSSLRALIQHRGETGLIECDVDKLTGSIMERAAQGKSISNVIELTDGRIIAISAEPMEGGGWVATHDDITERRKAEERIAYVAHHNAVTGLPNRTAFMEQLAEALDRAKAKRAELSLLCVDLDRFREVNELYGQAAGDDVLRQFADSLQARSGGAFIANLGGDEFAVIADGPQPATAEMLIGRLFETAAGQFEVDGHRFVLGVSVGVAIFPSDASDPTTLIANASSALHRAKAEGRRTSRFFEPVLDKRWREKHVLQGDLRCAVPRGELALHYQPQARMDGTIIGFEALARWTHPSRGPIPPGTFIPLAEDSELIGPIGEWILREACREAALWSNPLRIAINLSPLQLRNDDLVRLVHTVLLDTGLAASRLELEITEGALIGDYSCALSILRRLKALGVRIAMDDFGTGYSSLSYLQSFPFDKIKIDRSFVANADKTLQSGAIVRAIISLAHSLDLPVIAEGVETQEQLAFLRQQSCDEIQGFLIGLPRPIEAYGKTVCRHPINEANNRRRRKRGRLAQ